MKFGELSGLFSKWDYISSFYVHKDRSEIFFISEGKVESKDHVVIDKLIDISGADEVKHSEIGGHIHIYKFIFSGGKDG